jgi:serine/threonine protein kinase
MTPEIYRQAGELFDRLRELSDRELMPALDAACTGNAELRAQVMRLIEADRSAGSGSFLERRAVEDAARLLTPETPALPADGTVIGNYRLGARIGAGGMGVVYEGRDLHLDRRVAVKILPVTLAAEAGERIRRFQREARAASTLNHPHIVSIFDADFDQGYHYIAMEFVEGKTLRQLVQAQSQPLDSQTILDWIGQAASALSAAHAAGIVHRDIKPENIMIRPDGFIKVLDFGLAKLREPASNTAGASDLRTRPGNLAGTIQYLSPKQIQGEPAGPQSDLFSLGVVAYELATGVRPFVGPTDGAVFNAILNRTPPAPSAVRPSLGTELDGLIMRALEKDPELRFQTAGDLRSSCRLLNRDYIAKAIEKDHEIGHQQAASSVPSAPSVRRHSAGAGDRGRWWPWLASLPRLGLFFSG